MARIAADTEICIREHLDFDGAVYAIHNERVKRHVPHSPLQEREDAEATQAIAHGHVIPYPFLG